jgi:hypothetical protein
MRDWDKKVKSKFICDFNKALKIWESKGTEGKVFHKNMKSKKNLVISTILHSTTSHTGKNVKIKNPIFFFQLQGRREGVGCGRGRGLCQVTHS